MNGEAPPRWPAWYGPAAFLTALVAVPVASGIAVGILGGDLGNPSAGLIRLETVLQDAILVATALGFAALRAPPRPWHFGLRPTRLRPAVGWAALAMLVYVVFAAAYTAAIGNTEKQTTLKDLGVSHHPSAAALAAVGVLVVMVAPAVEEFFFRGFFYGALRSRFGILSAALIDGVVFGAVHLPSGAEAAPPLAALGFLFCLVYERTGSLYPLIALHALNNSLSFGVQTHDAGLAGALGAGVLAACLLVPRLAQRPRPVLR